jgi:Sigma-70 region 2
MNERDLIAAAQRGDEDAFGRLVARYRRELHAHAYRMLGSAADGEDALQDALLSAWRRLARFEGRSSLRSWLYPIRALLAPPLVREQLPDRASQDRRDGPMPASRVSVQAAAACGWLEASSLRLEQAVAIGPDPIVRRALSNQRSAPDARAMHWWIYMGIAWMALVGFFWCVLALGARADRRDARKGRRDAARAAPSEERATGGFARPPSVLTRRSATRATDPALRQHARRRR